MYVRVPVCIDVRVYVSMYVCVYVYTCFSVFPSIHTRLCRWVLNRLGAVLVEMKCWITALKEKRVSLQVLFCDVNAGTGKATEAELQKRYGADNVIFAQCDVTDAAQHKCKRHN